jgi:tRNA(fMet)-specific endonuclease VapC
MLDTDIASYAMNGFSAAVLRMLSGVPVEDVCISVITQAELMYGKEISSNPVRDVRKLDIFLRHVQVLDFPEQAAGHYGEIRAGLKRLSQMIGSSDLFIAAHARCLGLILVTNNVREFGRIPGLKIENWAE